MKPTDSAHRRVERAIKDVYRHRLREQADLMDADWTTRVLRQIRSSADVSDETMPLLWLFQDYLWRLAPVAAVLIVCMCVWMFNSGLNPDMEMAALSLDHPFNYSLLDSLGE